MKNLYFIQVNICLQPTAIMTQQNTNDILLIGTWYTLTGQNISHADCT